MKKHILFAISSALLVFLDLKISAQVAINADSSIANPSAMLDVKSSTRGLLPPRMTHVEINSISNPANGLIVYCTDCGTDGNGAYFVYINGTWNTILTCVPPVAPATGVHIPSKNQIIWNWNTVPDATGYRWNITSNYATAIDVGSETTKTETGLTCDTAYSRYIWAYNSCGISALSELTQTTSVCSSSGGPCPVTPTVTYGDKTYNTVLIGTQCWIKENLNIGTRINGSQGQLNNGIIEKYCYNDLESNCDIYGGLYQWDEAMQYATSEGVQGICPPGWHIPTQAELSAVATSLGGENIAGGKMKTTGTIEAGTGLWYSPNAGATNESGFTSVPAGYRYGDGNFYDKGYYGQVWSSTGELDWWVFIIITGRLTHNFTSMSISPYFDRPSGLSVRCFWETCPIPVAPVSGAHVPSATQITWHWDTVPNATGYKWGPANNYAEATDMGASTSFTETGLTCNTSCTRYLWSYNDCGHSTPVTLSQTTLECCDSYIVRNHVAGDVAPVTKTVYYYTTSSIPGQTSTCWTISNLGADHPADSVNDTTEASAGWYWQFNRKQGYKHDGTTRTPNSEWISTINENSDWIASNDPCAIELGCGWHIPTFTDWANVSAMFYLPSNWNYAYYSPLMLHAAGFLDPSNGSLASRGGSGYYGCSEQDDAIWAYGFALWSDYTGIFFSNPKPQGFSARCIRDN